MSVALDLVIGADLGGSNTRVAVADRSGQVLGRAQGPGGNPLSHAGSAATTFGKVLREALAGLDPARVRLGVIGLAGGSALSDPATHHAFEKAWRSAELAAPWHTCSDLEVAYSAASTESDGAVLVVGTGSAAAQVSGHQVRVAIGGHGWLIGDDGSGFWIGRQAARATVHAMESGEQVTGLAAAVRDHVGASDDPHEFIRIVMGKPPVALAELSRLVAQAHASGDPIAQRIHVEATSCVLDLWSRFVDIAPLTTGGVVAFAGSITRPVHPVGAALRAALTNDGWVVRDSVDPVLGAVRRAIALTQD